MKTTLVHPAPHRHPGMRAAKRIASTLGMAVMAMALLSACAGSTPAWNLQFGSSVKTLVAQQSAHPAAAANNNPIAGIDGGAARAAYERYQRSFSKPEAQVNVYTIGVGGK